MMRETGSGKLDGRPWFAEIQERHLRQLQADGAYLIQRRVDREWVRVAPDGSEAKLGYRDEK